jgi:aconitate hydratase
MPLILEIVTPSARVYSDTIDLDLGTVEPSLAGPSRPQDRVPLSQVKKSFGDSLSTLHFHLRRGVEQANSPRLEAEGGAQTAVGAQAAITESVELPPKIELLIDKEKHHLHHGSVVIAAITSCTNTSNPSVMLAAGLLAKKAVERGLSSKPWVKTSLAPGSKAVTEYFVKAGLMRYLEQLRFFLVGYGCTTCIGNSGPLPGPISKAIQDNELVVAAVLSGNRNFEGRIHPEVRANYLASPPLVVAYALAGRIDIDLYNEPLGNDAKGKPVFLKDIWPTQKEISDTVQKCVQPEMFAKVYSEAFKGDEHWNSLAVPKGDQYAWDAKSTYVKHPPYFENMPAQPGPLADIKGARVLALLGDSITTDHISPAGSIKPQSPAGQYLIEHGVAVQDFNSYGARRGNHEVMIRGTFANVRLKNKLARGTEGGFTRHLPGGTPMTIFDAAMKYRDEKIPLLILAGKEYGSGSSRDWAAKGPCLLGVRAVIAESFERIHRSNLVGMGILPLQFRQGESAAGVGLTGEEVYEIAGLEALLKNFKAGLQIPVRVTPAAGPEKTLSALIRIDTPQEVLYYRHGGILQYVLRQLLGKK